MLKKILEECYQNKITSEQALDKIIAGFPKQFVSKYRFDNSLEYMDKLLDLYSLVVLDNELTKKERGVLKYYLRSGYSDRVKDSIRKDIGISHQHLNQINWKLTNKGFLNKHPTNNRSKIVSPDLIQLKDTFFKDGIKHYTVIFEKNEG